MLNEVLYDINEVSNMTGLAPSTIKNHVRIGKFKTKKTDKKYFFTKNEIEQYLKNDDIIQFRSEKVARIMSFVDTPFSLSEFHKQYHYLISCGGTKEQQIRYMEHFKNDMILAIEREISHLNELNEYLSKDNFIDFQLHL